MPGMALYALSAYNGCVHVDATQAYLLLCFQGASLLCCGIGCCDRRNNCQQDAGCYVCLRQSVSLTHGMCADFVAVVCCDVLAAVKMLCWCSGS
jgi:hypothetical protein